ncbi:MAG: mandelate racemase/muconate lactonizing enzyme family protein [Bacillota bacterium]|nr:mandelate racemase/muconate lactonizing enzyme family protein [Bacillota bacterium]
MAQNQKIDPSTLRITDIRVADIVGAPMHCTLVKVYTNQGLVGFGEVRDGASRNYILQLKSRVLGQNPCNVDRIFRRIKQFGHHARQGGGVSGLEIALLDIAGKAWGVPVYQLLGGKFRDRIRIYCDTDVNGKHTGKQMGEALKKRMERGYTFLKMDVGIGLLQGVEGAISAPLGFLEEMRALGSGWSRSHTATLEEREKGHRAYEMINIPHEMTAIQITEKGLDYLEQYVREVREVIGYDIPLAVDHMGHIGLGTTIRLARRLEKFNLAWIEDPMPWYSTEEYVRLSRATTIPICTGEDIYLKENFRPLIEQNAVSVIHPDVLTTGGLLETKKIGDMADEHGVAVAIHMAESPIACLAAAHVAAALPNFLALEFHSNDVDWWDDIAIGTDKPIVKNGFIELSDAPGLGITDLNDEVIREHLHPAYPDLWADTGAWDFDPAHDRLWS